MAIAWVASWSNLTDADPCVVNTTAAAGSYLLGGAQTDNNNASDLTGLTAGWTYTHARLATTNDNAGFRSFDKDTAAAGNDSVSISSSSSNTSVGMVHEFTGVDLSTGPLDVAVVTTNTDSAGTNSDINVTPNTAGALVVYMHAVDDSTSSVTTTFSTTSGSTGAWDKKSDLNSGFFHMALGIASWTSGALTVRASSSVSASRSGAVHVLKPAATYALDQKGFRWGVDDANEASHTWEANEDTNITIADNQNRLLRTLVDVTSGEPASIAYTLRYQKNGSGGYTAVPVGATSKPTPVIESGDATESGSNTASGSWAVNYPNASTGDLLIFCISWDDSTNVTDVTEPSGPNGETLSEVNATPATDSGTNIRCKVWYTKATGTWTASTLTFTPSASEQWTASVVRVPAGEFDATTPIGASDTEGGSAAGTAAQHGSFTAGGSDGSGKLCVWTAVDTNPQTVASGFSQVSNTDRGAVSGGFFTRDTAVSDSESFSATNVSTMTSENWATVAFVVRAPTVNNEVYVAASANITDGEATTARLTAPSGKTSGADFQAGKRGDVSNALTLDLATGKYTEVERNIFIASTATDGDTFDFREYAGSSALDAYTATARWTIGGGNDMVAAGAVSISGAADLDALGQLVAAGAVSISGAADLDAIGQLLAAGALSVTGAADLDAAGQLVAAGALSISGVSDLDAVGQLVAAGSIIIVGASDLDALGQLVAAGSLIVSGVADLTSDADVDIAAAGSLSISGVADLDALGQLAAAGALSVSGLADLTSDSEEDMAAAGALSVTGAADLDALGQLVAAGTVSIAGVADLDALGQLVAAGLVSVVGVADLDAIGQLAAAGSVTIVGVADLDAIGQLVAAGALQIIGSADLQDANATRYYVAIVHGVVLPPIEVGVQDTIVNGLGVASIRTDVID